MIVRGLVKASKYGFDPKTHSVNSIVSCIVFGAILMTVGANLAYPRFGFGNSTITTSDCMVGSKLAVCVSAVGGGSHDLPMALPPL